MPRSTTPLTKTAAVKAAASKTAATKKRSVAPSVSQVDRTKGIKPFPKGPLSGAEEADTPPGLRATNKPGVFLNSTGTECDYRGIALALLRASKVSQEQAEIEVLGHIAKDPVDVLKFGALDRSLPLGVRLEFAKGAAPYTNRKMPVAVDGGANPNDPNGPGLPINIADLKGLDAKELASLKALLQKTQAASGG